MKVWIVGLGSSYCHKRLISVEDSTWTATTYLGATFMHWLQHIKSKRLEDKNTIRKE